MRTCRSRKAVASARIGIGIALGVSIGVAVVLAVVLYVQVSLRITLGFALVLHIYVSVTLRVGLWATATGHFVVRCESCHSEHDRVFALCDQAWRIERHE